MAQGILYLHLRPEMAKAKNLPIRLPIRIEDASSLHPERSIPLEIIFRGLESQYQKEPDDYYRSYYLFFLFEMVKHNVDHGEIDDALRLVETAKHISPEDFRVPFYSGYIARSQGFWGEAEGHYRDAIQRNPTFGPACFELGEVLIEKGEEEEAIPIFEHLITLDLQFFPAYLKLGDLSMKSGNLEAAKLWYEQSLIRSSYSFSPAMVRLGVLFNTEQRFEQAEKFLRRAINVDSDLFEGHYNLAFTLQRLEQPFQAIIHLKQCTEMKPEAFGPKNQLFVLYKQMGLYDEAWELGASIDDERFSWNWFRFLLLMGQWGRAGELETKLDASCDVPASHLHSLVQLHMDSERRNGPVLPFHLQTYLSQSWVQGSVPETHRSVLRSIIEGVIPFPEMDQPVPLILLDLLLPIFSQYFSYPFELERAWTHFSVGVAGSMKFLALCRCFQTWVESILLDDSCAFEAMHERWIQDTMDISWSFSQKIYHWGREDLKDLDSLFEEWIHEETLDRWLFLLFNLWQTDLSEEELIQVHEFDQRIANWLRFFKAIQAEIN